jgi:hypothetical protein
VPRFAYQVVWQQSDPALADELVAFWRHHGAIVDEQVARRRAGQVVAVARSTRGGLAGVCTAMHRELPDLGQPVYYYRTFVAPPYRHGLIVRRLLAIAVAELEAFSRSQPERGAAGIYLELENPVFGRHLRQAVWPAKGLEFVYIGRTSHGLERRILWFRHARI